MKVDISQKHPLFEMKPKIQEICQPFFSTFGFSYFQYLRCYADGSISLLTNNTAPFEYFQQKGNQPAVYSSFENTSSYWFLWDEKLPGIPVQIVRQRCHVHNGLTLVRRTKNYYDMIAVGLPREQENPGTFYFNKLKAIEQFINDFDKDNKDLIRIATKNPIALPEQFRDENYKTMCLKTGRLTIQGKYEESYITSQEMACLRLFIQGHPYKAIAQMLDLSNRTVETYFKRIKERTSFSSLKELKKQISTI